MRALAALLAACAALAGTSCTDQADKPAPAIISATPAREPAAPAPAQPASQPSTATGSIPVTLAPTSAPAAPASAAPAPAPPPAPAAAAAASKGIEQRSGTTSNGAFVVSWVPVPDPIPFNESFKLLVTIARAASPTVPERAARLELDATMPAHGHGMNRTPAVTAKGDGTFLVDGMLFHMSGEWNLIFHVYVGTEYGQAILRVDLP
jgi:hypothetical protein